MKRFIILAALLLTLVLPSYAEITKDFVNIIDIKDTLTALDTALVTDLTSWSLRGTSYPEKFILLGKIQDTWSVDTTIDTLTTPPDTTIDTTWIDTTTSPSNTATLRIDAFKDNVWYLDVSDSLITATANYGIINYVFKNRDFEQLRFVLTNNTGWVYINFAFIKED